jgi:predicted nuclease of predicted toxin-antitoxin system
VSQKLLSGAQIEELIISALHQIEEKIISVQGDVAALVQKGEKSKQYSASVLGQLELHDLELKGWANDAEVEPGEESCWPEQRQAEANAIKTESDLVHLLHTLLEPFHMVFVNSENIEWFPQSKLLTDNKTDLKPDGFATHGGMYRKKKVLQYGVPEKALLDCNIFF